MLDKLDAKASQANQVEEINCQVVHSTIGRFRICVPHLATDPECSCTLQYWVESLDFVTSVRINPAARSIVVNYEDTAIASTTAQEKLVYAIKQALRGDIPLVSITEAASISEHPDSKEREMQVHLEEAAGQVVGGTVGAAVGAVVGEVVGAVMLGPVGMIIGEEIGTCVGQVIGTEIGREVVDVIEHETLEQSELTEQEIIEGLEIAAGETLGESVGEIVGRVLLGPAGAVVGEEIGACVGGIIGTCAGEEIAHAVEHAEHAKASESSEATEPEVLLELKAAACEKFGESVGEIVGKAMMGPAGTLIGEVIGVCVGEVIASEVGEQIIHTVDHAAEASEPSDAEEQEI